MNFKNIYSISKLLIAAFLVLAVVGCHDRNPRKKMPLTGWSDKDKVKAGFNPETKYRGQNAPPGMVLIEGGTFTMGHVQDDVLFDWNTTPNQQQVRSFYLDETEVTNSE